jgi:hypothetical protein
MKDILERNKIFVFIFLITLISIMYVNQNVLIYQMGLKVKENHQIYCKLVDHNRILVYNVLSLKSPVSLEARLLKKNLDLGMPRKWQVVKLGISPRELVHRNVAKKGLFATLFVIGREAEASPNVNSIDLAIH